MKSQGLYTASAPGKVILCGEYAVLEGAPSLVLAVNRRVSVEYKPVPASGKLEVSSPGFLAVPEVLELTGQGWRGKQVSQLSFVVRLLNALLAERQLCGGQLTIDSRPFFDQQNKLGLGSSAALSAALAGVLGLAEKTPAQHWLMVHQAHSLAQGKQGSGVDVAASLAGGASRFVNLRQKACQLSNVGLPADIQLVFLWTGASASTVRFLGSLRDWKQAQPAAYENCMTAMSNTLNPLCNAPGVADMLVKGLKCFTEALFEFAGESQLPVFASPHVELFELGRTFHDLVYKPCGAGGGDLGLVVSADPQATTAFVQRAAELGATAINLSLDPKGLQVLKK